MIPALRQIHQALPKPLDLQFWRGEFDPRIAFTRATTATRFNHYGVLETVAAGVMRLDYDPSTLRTSTTSLTIGIGWKVMTLSSAAFAAGHYVRITRTSNPLEYMVARVMTVVDDAIAVYVEAIGGSGTYDDWTVIRSLGLLIEEERTNRVPDPESISLWADTGVSVLSDDRVGPTGAMEMDKLTRTTGAADARYKTLTGLSDGTKYLSVFLAGDTAVDSLLWWRDVTVGSRHGVKITWTAGVPALETTSGGGILYPVQDCGGGVYRVMISVLGVVAANDNRVYLHPAHAGSSNGQSCYAWGFMAGEAPTSYTPISAAADVASMTGTNFSDWYNAAVFSMLAEFTGQESGTRVYWEISDGTANNYISLRSVAGALALVIMTGGVEQASLSLGTVTTGTRYRVASRWAEDDIAASIGGASPVTDASAMLPTVDRLHAGSDGAGANQSCAPIALLRGYASGISNAQLQALSS